MPKAEQNLQGPVMGRRAHARASLSAPVPDESKRLQLGGRLAHGRRPSERLQRLAVSLRPPTPANAAWLLPVTELASEPPTSSLGIAQLFIRLMARTESDPAPARAQRPYRPFPGALRPQRAVLASYRCVLVLEPTTAKPTFAAEAFERLPGSEPFPPRFQWDDFVEDPSGPRLLDAIPGVPMGRSTLTQSALARLTIPRRYSPSRRRLAPARARGAHTLTTTRPSRPVLRRVATSSDFSLLADLVSPSAGDASWTPPVVMGTSSRMPRGHRRAQSWDGIDPPSALISVAPPALRSLVGTPAGIHRGDALAGSSPDDDFDIVVLDPPLGLKLPDVYHGPLNETKSGDIAFVQAALSSSVRAAGRPSSCPQAF